MTVNALPRISKTDSLGRYYTSAHASDVLVSQFARSNPRRVLDLGSGSGALSFAARSVWKQAEILTVDIDASSKRTLGQLSDANAAGRFKHFRVDALRPDLPEILGGSAALSDVAICNPPFIKPKWRKGFDDVLNDAGLDACYASRHDITAEVLFLAQNLRLVRDDGQIGIIVPDSIICGKKHYALRERLLATHRIESVIRLPRTAFAGTDAQGYVLTLTKNRPSLNGIKALEMFSDGTLSAPLLLDPRDAIARLDVGPHQTGRNRATTRLADVAISIRRGNVVSNQRNNRPYPAFHTTDFPCEEGAGAFAFPSAFDIHEQTTEEAGAVAHPGDILIARVGRNLERKVCLVTSGNAVVTDCVYVIRTIPGQAYRVFKALSSTRGKDWLARMSHGVSARQLPKCDLLNFPI